ncbi:MAG TPA: HAD family phosphatase [Acidobacteriota bacterium]|nr:HAD family phosphatase [Acidobacteriota bacterium]
MAPYPKLLALDAMGVIYAEADDGPNLLYPFIVENGGCRDVGEVVRLYSAASLGTISSAEFWRLAGVDPSLEDTYLLRHRLTDGLIQFLDDARSRGIQLWCLSNDVSEWSQKLRRRFGLDRYFQGFVISGDVGARKPDPDIYRSLLDQAGMKPADALFVDDRLRNVKAADEMGISAILFKPAPGETSGHGYRIATSFAELLRFLQ